MERSRVAIVIPAFNEAAAIGRVVEGARRFGTVVVVDDGSTDATATVASTHGADVVRLVGNSGYDGALQAGAERAHAIDAACFLTMDADGQHDPDLIPVFLERLNAGADVVIGIRERFQRVGEWLFSVAGRALWGIADPLCGMKCYRMRVYEDLGHFDAYRSIGTELAIFAARNGRRIENIPIHTLPRRGPSRFGAGWRANRRILCALACGLVAHKGNDAGVRR